jgi:hypothetical protein
MYSQIQTLIEIGAQVEKDEYIETEVQIETKA